MPFLPRADLVPWERSAGTKAPIPYRTKTRCRVASTVNKEKRERALTRLAEAHVDEFLRYMRDESDEEATTR